jgi:hypothetical protein
MLQAILQVMLYGVGPVGYYFIMLKGVLFAGWYASRRFIPGSLFLDVVLAGRFVPGALVSGALVPG